MVGELQGEGEWIHSDYDSDSDQCEEEDCINDEDDGAAYECIICRKLLCGECVFSLFDRSLCDILDSDFCFDCFTKHPSFSSKKEEEF